MISPDEKSGCRLDVYVSECEGVTRSFAQKLIESGAVTVNGKVKPKNYRIADGDVIDTDVPEPADCEAEPQDIPLDIIFEDADIIVINKPQGMVVHPAPGNPDGTLVNALLYHCRGSLSGIGGVARPGIVHRIDRDTSGLIVAAKTDAAHLKLSEALKVHGVAREYKAIVAGGFNQLPQPDADFDWGANRKYILTGKINAPIARHPVDRKRMAVVEGGRDAVTHYAVAERLGAYSLLDVRLETGRTHQIRVHMAHISHPVLGDPVYGGDRGDFYKKHASLFRGQCLHAGRLRFIHPASGEPVEFFAPPPKNFEQILALLRADCE